MNAEDAGREGGQEMDARVAETVFGWVWFEWSEKTRPRGAGRTRMLTQPGNEGRYWFSPADLSLPVDEDYAATVPHYSTDIAEAWKVVEALHAERCRVYVDISGRSSMVEAMVERDGAFYVATADNAPLAICRAALAAFSPTLEDR